MRAFKVIQSIQACTVADLVPNSGICALINGQQVAIFYVPSANPAVYAIGNWDPAGKANVLSRGLIADIRGQLTVASPLYKHHFNLATGQCLENPALVVPVYNVDLVGDDVRLSL